MTDHGGHKDRRFFLTASAALAAALAHPQGAGAQQAVPVRFDGQWQSMTFPRITPTRFGQAGAALTIEGDASASLIYLPAPDVARGARMARWSWSITSSVPPTDLTRKGGDDRNISVYFVFMDAASAARLSPGTSPPRLLTNRSARVLMYVWGGNHAPGSLLPSPYMRGRGFSIVLRPAGTGQAQARVDLGADYRRAFGNAPEALVGLAVSADSDDTRTALRASLSDLTLSQGQ